jgi:O-acetylhomoserine/O-acetylserine sulfhydrylase-like pyridoxal-dependent enzyme
MIDNTFATPYLCRPFEWGANIIVHSTTKFLGGHGTTIGGVIVDGGNFDWTSGRFANFTTPDPSYHGLVYADLGAPAFILKTRVQTLRDVGACQAPINSWLTIQGIETLSLRMDRHVSNAQAVAEWLEAHPQVKWVSYPGLRSHPDHTRVRSICRRGRAQSWASAFAAGSRPDGASSTAAALQSSGERRRREEPCHSSRQHDPQPTHRGRDGHRRRHPRLHPPEHRPGRYRRHPVGSGQALE